MSPQPVEQPEYLWSLQGEQCRCILDPNLSVAHRRR
jgi:hypothetical protein